MEQPTVLVDLERADRVHDRVADIALDHERLGGPELTL
jgi:hypothetical protein